MAKQPLPLPAVLGSPAQGAGAYETEFYKFLASLREVLNDHTTRMGAGTGAADPTADDIPDGESRIWKNTGSGVLALWSNDGGTLKSVALT